MKGKRRYIEIVNFIEQKGASRLKAQGGLDHGDYLMGAAAALMVALDWNPGDLPASWTLGLMSGTSPIDDWFTKLVGIDPPKGTDRRGLTETIRRLEREIDALTEQVQMLVDIREGRV